MRTIWRALAGIALAASTLAGTARAAGEALVIDIEGTIGPATAAFVEGALEAAESERAAALVLRMDTPGGLDTSMRSIVKAITGSSVPVIGYVAPTGARAASAGTYILYACQIAAMAPGTNLGAATPVQIGGLPGVDPPADPNGSTEGEDNADSGGSSPPAGDAKNRKLVNDAAAYLRGLAALHGRNAEWAERAVREGVSLSAEEAVRLGVVDLVAADIPTLLAAVDGRTVRLGDGQITLRTAGIAITERQPDWQNRLLAIISNPNVAYILLLIGIYGLIYEFSNPGAVFPGALGAMSLLLALYAFQLLPVNYAGLALIVLGLALMIGEAFTPSFGALGLGGTALFVVGSLILIDTEAPGLGISLPLILGFAVSSALLLAFMIGIALRAWRRPVASGAEELQGAVGEAVSGFPGSGRVHLHGEIWGARSDSAIPRGASVRVVGREGLTLRVEPQTEENTTPEE
jgi:membrane-bound serine protease (ClpP class)